MANFRDSSFIKAQKLSCLLVSVATLSDNQTT